QCRHFGCFFQAEDGIRDWSVTGVQTCALPIYQVYSMASPWKWRHTSVQPRADRRAEGSADTKGAPASSTNGGPGVEWPNKRRGSAMRASAAANRASQNRALAAPSGSLLPGMAVRMWITPKPNACSGRSTSSQRTAFSGGAVEGRSQRSGIRESTQMPLSMPTGLLEAMCGHPLAAKAWQRAMPGLARNSVRAMISGLWSAIALTMRTSRVPPPCWMFQERSFMRLGLTPDYSTVSGSAQGWQNLSQAVQEFLPIHRRQPADAAYDQAVIQGEKLHADDAGHLQSRVLMVDSDIQWPRRIACVGNHGHDGRALRVESASAQYRGRALHTLSGAGEWERHDDDLKRITGRRNSRDRGPSPIPLQWPKSPD